MLPSAHLGQLLSPLCPRNKEKTAVTRRSLTRNLREFVKQKASQEQAVIISTQQGGKTRHGAVKSAPCNSQANNMISDISPWRPLYNCRACEVFARQLPTHLVSCPSPCVEADAPTFPARCLPPRRCRSRAGAAESPSPTSSAFPAWLACASWSCRTSAASRGREAETKRFTGSKACHRGTQFGGRAHSSLSCHSEHRLWQLQIPTGSAAAWSDPLASQIKQEHYVLVPPRGTLVLKLPPYHPPSLNTPLMFQQKPILLPLRPSLHVFPHLLPTAKAIHNQLQTWHTRPYRFWVLGW